MADELRYEDLQLGERAKEAYLRGMSPMEINQTLPIFLNTNEVYTTGNGDRQVSLSTTDLMIVAVLAGMNVWTLGKKGTGKTVAMKDFADFYFGGDIRSGGQSYLTEMGNEFDLAHHLLEPDQEKPGCYKLKGTHKACFFGLDEINHTHAKKQTESYNFLQGQLTFNGFNEPLGRKGYSLVFATGNDPRDEESNAPFDSDGAFVDRFGVILDLNDPRLAGTDSDNRFYKRYVLGTKAKLGRRTRDITDKIIGACGRIERESTCMDIRAEAAFNYIDESLSKCPGRKTPAETSAEGSCRKGSIIAGCWPKDSCFDCEKKQYTDGNATKSSLCYLLDTSNARPSLNARRFASALGYLARLKNPLAEIDGVDLAFLAYEVCGAYQKGVLNEPELRENFHNRNHQMMKEVMRHARNVFDNSLGERYITQLERAKRGLDTARFYVIGDKGILVPSDRILSVEEEIKLKAGFLGSSGSKKEIEAIQLKKENPIGEDDQQISTKPLVDALQEEINLAKKVQK